MIRVLPALACGVLLSLVLPANAQSSATFTVNSTADTQDAAPGDGQCRDAAGSCTLRAAVMEGNALGAATIRLPAGVFRLTKFSQDNSAANGDLDITGDIVIRGVGMNITYLFSITADSNSGADRVFNVKPSGSLTISDLSITKSYALWNAEKGGAAILAEGDASPSPNEARVRVNRVMFSEVVTNADGGAIACLRCGELTITNSVFKVNRSQKGAGGAVYVLDSVVTIKKSRFEDNIAGSGGALYITGSQITLSKLDFVNNSFEWQDSDENPNPSGTIHLEGNSGTIEQISTWEEVIWLSNNPNLLISDSYLLAGSILLIYSPDSSNVLIEGSTLTGWGVLVYLPSALDLNVRNTTFSHEYAGLSLNPADGWLSKRAASEQGNLRSTAITLDHSLVENIFVSNFGEVVPATVALKSSIISNISPWDETSCNENTFVSQGHNILNFPENNPQPCGMQFQASDILGDPKLLALNFDGPDGFVPMRELAPDSPAINAGDNITCPEFDQRGVTRPRTVENPCDIGPVEYEGLLLITDGSFEVDEVGAFDEDHEEIPDGVPDHWTASNRSKDKRQCYPEVWRLILGDCSFRFKDPAGKLTQSLTTLPAGEVFFGAFVDTDAPQPVTVGVLKLENAAGEKLKLKLRTNGPTRVPIYSSITYEPGEYYTFIPAFTYTRLRASGTAPEDVTSGKVILQFKSPVGKAWIDGVWLWSAETVEPVRAGRSAILPPPDAPDGFRGAN